MIKSIFHKLLDKWYVYLLILIVSVTASVYWVNFMTIPRNEETITIFMSSFSSSTSKLRQELEKNKPSYLREINIVNVAPNDSTFDYQFALKGVNYADMFILPDEKIVDDFVKKQVIGLNNEYFKSYISSPTYSYEDKGVVLHNKGEENNDLITFKTSDANDSNYHIFFRSNSLHIGLLNNTKYDTALIFSKVLLEYGKK